MQQCRHTPPGFQWILMDCEGMELCLTLSGSGALALVREMAELLDADSRVEITDLVVDLLRRRRLERGGAQPVSPGLGQAIHDECQQPTAATPLPALAAASSGTSPTAQPVSPGLRQAIDEERPTATSAAGPCACSRRLHRASCARPSAGDTVDGIHRRQWPASGTFTTVPRR